MVGVVVGRIWIRSLAIRISTGSNLEPRHRASDAAVQTEGLDRPQLLISTQPRRVHMSERERFEAWWTFAGRADEECKEVQWEAWLAATPSAPRESLDKQVERQELEEVWE